VASPNEVASALGAGIEILHHRPGEYIACSWKNIFVCLWYGTATSEGLHPLQQALLRASQPHDKVSVVYVLMTTAGMPSEATREDLKRAAERGHQHRGCLVTVIEGDGFRASALRSLSTGYSAMSPKRTTHYVARTVAEAAMWLAEPHTHATNVRVDKSTLRAVLQAMHDEAVRLAS